MIIDLERFIQNERPAWRELESLVARLEGGGGSLSLEQARRLHYLYERSAGALSRINTFSSDPDARRYLESLVARAYAAIGSMDRPRRRLRPLHWFFATFPTTFRRHLPAFGLSVAVTLAGVAFGAAAVAVDDEAKSVILPFGQLLGDPAERVRMEEERPNRGAGSAHATFAAVLMSNNIRVSILAMALGLTFGIGVLALLFYNGAILGAVILDYVRAGQTSFLVGWLLPHGSIEIPSILIAGQAGFVLASALIGRGDRDVLRLRLRKLLPSVGTLMLGVAVLLVWAGIIESFFSQFHQPVLPYWLKILFGCCELAMLTGFLAYSGRGRAAQEAPA